MPSDSRSLITKNPSGGTSVPSAENEKSFKELAQKTAEELDANREIYYYYAIFDSLSSTYSNFKLGFDLCAVDNSTNAMHDFMLTPEAIIIITLEATFLLGYSLVACEFETKDGTYSGPQSPPSMPLFRRELKRLNESLMPFFQYLFKRIFGYSNLSEGLIKEKVAASWPLFREIMKGFKNAYKGWRSTILALGLLAAYNTAPLILPVGLVLAVVAAANRYCLRVIVDRRKEMMKFNQISLAKIQGGQALTVDERAMCIKPRFYSDTDTQSSTVSQAIIKSQTQNERYYSFGGVAFNGFIDGMYLYVGVLSIGVLAPQAFFCMSILCGIYALACIITRVYEEYDFQLRLQITQTKYQLHVTIKTLENYSMLLINDKALYASDNNELLKNKILQNEDIIRTLLAEFEVERNTLKKQLIYSYLEVFFIGIKNGLYTYSALTSFVFLIGIVMMVSSTPFPPLLLILTVPMGMLFIIGCIIDAMYTHANFLRTPTSATLEREALYNEHQHCMQSLSVEKQSDYFTTPAFLGALQAAARVDIPPYPYYSEMMEVIRSLGSGFSKGYKFIGFTGNAFQEMDEQGNYHDSKGMLICSSLGSAVFAGVLAYRALAKGVAKPPLGLADGGLFGSKPKPEADKKSHKQSANLSLWGLFTNKSQPQQEKNTECQKNPPSFLR